MNPFFSIIVPAYNAQASIAQCLQSVAEQDFTDLELIVVDDGSTDKTVELSRQFAGKIPNLKIVQIKNQGPAAARNVGMKKAAGKYILFLDSDDLYLHGALHNISALLKEEPVDMLIFGFELVMKQTETVFHNYHAEKTIRRARPAELQISKLYVCNILNQVWNKAYGRAFLEQNDITFQDFRYGEDRLFVVDCLNCAQSVTVVPDEYYSYVIANKDSLVHTYYEKKFDVCCLIHQQMMDLCRNEPPKDKGILNYMFLKSVFSCMCSVAGKKSGMTFAEKRREIRRMVTNQTVELALQEYQSPNLVFTALCLCMKTRCAAVNTVMAWMAEIAMEYLPDLTISLKHNQRGNE